MSQADREALAAAAQARSELEQTERAFDELRQSFVEAVFATSADNPEERERLYLAVKVLDRVRSTVRMVAAGSAVPEYNAMVRDLLDGKALV